MASNQIVTAILFLNGFCIFFSSKLFFVVITNHYFESPPPPMHRNQDTPAPYPPLPRQSVHKSPKTKTQILQSICHWFVCKHKYSLFSCHGQSAQNKETKKSL